MITRAQITRRADADGVNAKVVERDYVLAHVVALIASRDIAPSLVFKGGTSLRLLHFDRYRYSADLDYSITSGTLAEARALIASALILTPGAAITALGLTADDPPRIEYRGPLGKPRTIKLDLAADELVVETERRSMLDRWADVPSVQVTSYTLLEVAGEKLRCVLQRLQCRDLLDLDVLFASGIGPDDAAALFVRKAVHRGLDPSSFAATFARRAVEYEARWQVELVEHVGGELPPCNEVLRRVKRSLRSASLI